MHSCTFDNLSNYNIYITHVLRGKFAFYCNIIYLKELQVIHGKLKTVYFFPIVDMRGKHGFNISIWFYHGDLWGLLLPWRPLYRERILFGLFVYFFFFIKFELLVMAYLLIVSLLILTFFSLFFLVCSFYSNNTLPLW